MDVALASIVVGCVGMCFGFGLLNFGDIGKLGDVFAALCSEGESCGSAGYTIGNIASIVWVFCSLINVLITIPFIIKFCVKPRPCCACGGVAVKQEEVAVVAPQQPGDP